VHIRRKRWRLAQAYARDEAGALDKIKEIVDFNLDGVADHSRARKAQELVQEFRRREPDAVSRSSPTASASATSP
jgi:hypothetical protein